MTVSKFDRLRPRVEPADPAQGLDARAADAQTPLAQTPLAQTPDAQGKRALFSSTELSRPSGGILIECSRCTQTTALTPTAALRAAFPALHLSVVIGHGDRQTPVGLLRRRHYGSWLRCPSCGQGSWTRVTIRF